MSLIIKAAEITDPARQRQTARAVVAPPPMALCTPATAKGSLEVDLVKVPIRTAAVARPETAGFR